MDFKETDCKDEDLITVVQDEDKCRAGMNVVVRRQNSHGFLSTSVNVRA
jgi:hypothetical protein